MGRIGRALATLTLAFLLAPGPLQAQFGIRGGISLTDLLGDDVGETDRRRGLNLGAFVDLFRTGPLQVAAEVYYRQKGTDFTSLQGDLAQGQAPPDNIELGLDYVEIPVLLRWNVVQGRRARFYVAGGPAFAWRIDCGVTISAGAGTTTPSCDDLLRDNLQETLEDYEQGLVLAGGVDLLVLQGMGAVNLDARYTRGLSRVTSDLDWKNEALSVMLGWTFAPRW